MTGAAPTQTSFHLTGAETTLAVSVARQDLFRHHWPGPANRSAARSSSNTIGTKDQPGSPVSRLFSSRISWSARVPEISSSTLPADSAKRGYLTSDATG